MHNPVLDKLRSIIGQDLSQSPAPLGAWLCGIVRKAEYGSLTVEFTVRRDMTNTLGFLHGGATAAIMDDLMGMTVSSLGREHHFVTLNLSIDYLYGAKEGETITATTHVVREGKQVANLTCEIVNAEGKLLSKASSNLMKTGLKKE
jgi:acyl-coenzyme A thioesterase 13